MRKRNIWIDCDPGIDDAIMLGVASVSRDQLHILGVSTVAGNQTGSRITENALRLASVLGMGDVPVHRGADGPLVREKMTAGEVHGETGLGSCVLPPTEKTAASENAVLALRDCILALPEGEKLTLVPTGPLTNIALLLRAFPEVKPRIEELVLMGGAAGPGNVTPYAEFNIYVDPEAARMVFSEGVPIVMCGLDVTLKSGLTAEQCRALWEDENPMCRNYGQMLCSYGDSSAAGGLTAIHDAVTVLYLLHPELFGGERARVRVDCSWGEQRGRTLCERDEQGPVLLLDRADLPGFQKILLEKLHQCRGDRA